MVLGVNHIMDMVEMGMTNMVVRPHYLPLLVTADSGKGVLSFAWSSSMHSLSLGITPVFPPMQHSNGVLR
jgi:hypothetical protein